MLVIPVTEGQLHAMMPAAIRYQQALVVRDTSVAQLQRICQPYAGVEVVEPIPAIPSHEQHIILVRLLRPTQREMAMVVPYWPGIPRPLLSRVTQLRLVR